jgi:hypothetical protein
MHCLLIDAQKEALSGYGNHRNFYGTVETGSGKQGYMVLFDDLPAGNQQVTIRRRNIMTVLQENEEEAEYDHRSAVPEECAQIDRARKEDPMKASARLFCGMDRDTIATATKYQMQHGNGEGDVIEWNIVPDDEHVNWPTPNIPNNVEYLRSVQLDDDSDLSDIFFAEFFPCVTGHAMLIDEFHSSPKSPYFLTVCNDRIKFNDPESSDPDWRVKHCYTIMIAAASEVENGVENLWKRGPSGGRHDYPNFGQYMPINYFKAFEAAAPYCWCEKKCWYVDKRDRPWDIFLPCLNKFNEKRQGLVKVDLLMLDESMSGWRPKTSKLGGLPNFTFEPRKPIPLGTMFRNGVECISGLLVFQDVVQNPEMQSCKSYFNEESSLPGNPPITAHAAEVLRQVEGAQIAEGGWVGGDAWFGSVLSTVEVMKRLKVHSTFIIIRTIVLFFRWKLCMQC